MEVKLTTGLEKERIIVAERPAATLSMGENLVLPNSWSRNGESVVTTNSGLGQGPSYLALFQIGDQKPVRLLAGKGNQTNGQDIARREMARVCLRRIGRMEHLRDDVPKRRGQVAGVGWRWH